MRGGGVRRKTHAEAKSFFQLCRCDSRSDVTDSHKSRASQACESGGGWGGVGWARGVGGGAKSKAQRILTVETERRFIFRASVIKMWGQSLPRHPAF